MTCRRWPLLSNWALLGALVAGPGCAATSGAQPFLGRWDAHLVSQGRSVPTWFEIREDAGRIRIRMVGRWGHARELSGVSLQDGQLRFTSPREEEGGQRSGMAFFLQREEDALTGVVEGPDAARWTIRATRAPSLRRERAPQWGPAVELFSGEDLSRWEPLDPAAPGWRVVEGTLLSPGHGTELRTRAVFGDFQLHLEFFCNRGANSGVYLRGRYEVQIEDDAEPEGPDRRTGAVYGFLAPGTPAGKIAGAWHALDVTLVGRTVTIALDGRTLVDRGEIPGITGGALDSDEGAPGPVILQGSEAGHVHFRALRIAAAAGEGEMP